MTIEDNQNPPDDNPEKNTWQANMQLAVVLLFIIGAFILSQIIGIGEKETAKSTKTLPVLVRTVEVSPSTQSIRFIRTGETEVNNQIRIVPQVSGRISSVHPDFDDGGVFEAGTSLFQIEQDDYINQRDIAQAEVERAQTQLALEEAETQAAREEWESLNPGKSIPALVARQPQSEQAKANLKAATAQFEKAELDLKRATYILPYDGRVIETDIEIGQYVQAGQSYGTLYSRDAVQVRVPLEDRLLKYIDKDKATAIISTNYRGQNMSLRGKIERIGGQVDENTRFVDVIITPEGSDWNKILPNLFAEVELIGQEMEGLWQLPNNTLQGTEQVWIVQDDQTLKSYTPHILSIGKEYTLALGNGETATLVEGLLKGAGDGMKVRLVDQAGKDTAKINDNTRN
jgi:membrane fusion protein, multidrug efflux system